MTREGASAGSLFWAFLTFLLGTLSGRWATARARAGQVSALTAALERVAHLEAENDRLRDDAAQRLDSAFLLAPPRAVIRVPLHGHRPKRRRRL